VTLQRPSDIPAEPGVYRFRDERGVVIYVGKALSLRSRLGSYFSDQLPARTAAMLAQAADVDWVVVSNESEALILEYTWIKEYDPRFNVKYRDDKSYPYVAVTTGEAFPRFRVTRENHRRGSRYFGPYAHAWAIRDTVDQLQWVYPIRSCRDGVFRRAQQTGRPCLLGYIDKCSAPCVGRIDEQAYRVLVDEFCAFLSGDPKRALRALEVQMDAAAREERFEEAATLRDRHHALSRALASNSVALGDGVEADVVALVDEPLELAVQVFHVRDGMVIGERGFIIEKDEEADLAGYADRVLQHLYASEDSVVPREVLINALPAGMPAWHSLLSERRGSAVDIRIPVRGKKAALMEVVLANAQQALERHQRDRTRDLTTRSLALRELQDSLALASSPLRIECIDISTMQGEATVGALVVFEDALPKPSDYRSYVIRGATDDVSSIREVIGRRFRNADQESPYRPGLLVVDGGQPQVRAAHQALAEAGVTDLPVIGLAKRLEEVWPAQGGPVIMSRRSEGLYLLQRIRDEAHRRAIRHHRKRKGQQMRTSALDGVPGLGPARARQLVAQFGSVKRIRSLDVAQLAEAPGIGPVLAARIVQHLQGEQPVGESRD